MNKRMKYSKKFKKLVRQTIDEKFKPMLVMDGQEIHSAAWADCPIFSEYHCSLGNKTCPIENSRGGCTRLGEPFSYMLAERERTTRRMRSHARKVIKWLETFLEES